MRDSLEKIDSPTNKGFTVEKLLSQIAHLEITSPDVKASAAFYTEKFGMRQVDFIDGISYLRCWDDHYKYSLVVSPGPQPSLKNMAWRTTSAAALDAAAKNVAATGTEITWIEGGYGHGRAFEFNGPDGHRMKIVWEVERFVATPEQKSIFPDRPEKRSSHAAAPRFLDHVTVCSKDVRKFAEFYQKTLGFRPMAFTDLDEAPITVFGVLTTNEKSHDLGIVLDTALTPARVNHIAFWVDAREDLSRAADVIMENGTPMEYGPSIHGIGEQSYLYFREPSGLRIELNSGGYRNYIPDWEPNTWSPAEGSNNMFMNNVMPMSMTESFPPAEGFTATEDGASEEMKALLLNPYAVEGNG
jgi:catechol 2,3-dioxygenase